MPHSDLELRYRNVFGTMEGKKVLADILTKGHFGMTLDGDNRDQIAEYNFALVIGTLAGAFDGVYRQLEFTTKGD